MCAFPYSPVQHPHNLSVRRTGFGDRNMRGAMNDNNNNTNSNNNDQHGRNEERDRVKERESDGEKKVACCEKKNS